MLVVHDTAAWLLLAACSLAGVVQSVGARLRAGAGGGGGEIGRLARVGGFADAVLTGLGVGMGAASIVLIAAAIIARLQA